MAAGAAKKMCQYFVQVSIVKNDNPKTTFLNQQLSPRTPFDVANCFFKTEGFFMWKIAIQNEKKPTGFFAL